MKKIFEFLLVALTFTACQKETGPEQPLSDEVTENDQFSDLQAAKATLSDLFYYGEQYSEGNMPEEEHSVMFDSLEKKFKDQRGELSEADSIRLARYAVERLKGLQILQD